MNNGLTLQEYIDLLQEEINSGRVDSSLPVAVCSHANPRDEYWLLAKEYTTVEKHGDIVIITY